MSRRARRRLQIGIAALTGIIALSAYAGVVGLVGGAISFDETINARLPYQSLFSAISCCSADDRGSRGIVIFVIASAQRQPQSDGIRP